MRELKSLGPFSFCLLFLCVQKKNTVFFFALLHKPRRIIVSRFFPHLFSFFLRKERKRKREKLFFFFHPSQFFFFVYNLRDGAFCHLVTLDPYLLFKFLFLFPIVIFSSLPLSVFYLRVFIFSFFFFCFFPSLYSHLFWVFFFFVLSQSSFFFFGFFGFLFRPLFFVSSLLFSVVIHDRFFFIVHYSELPRLFSIFFSYYLLLCDITPLFYQHLFLRFWTGIAQEKEERRELRKLESCRFKVFEPHKINSGTHI